MSWRLVLLAATSFLSSRSPLPSWVSPSDLVVEPSDIAHCILVQGADTIPLSSGVCTFPAGFMGADPDTSFMRR